MRTITIPGGITSYNGSALEVLRTLPDNHWRCCVTSPPYYGLRDYGVDGQLGLEGTPEAYIAALVDVFREARRVLTDDGTLWLNIGDSYAAGGNGTSDRYVQMRGTQTAGAQNLPRKKAPAGLKPKDLIGIPWMVAFALRADGWYLRQDIIWNKPNPMPESVRDRCTKSHEYIFLLSKSSRYFYSAAAIAELSTNTIPGNVTHKHTTAYEDGDERSRTKAGLVRYAQKVQDAGAGLFRNARSVWNIATQPYSEAHFATFPEELPRRCILAGSEPGDRIGDPFGGSGTTAMVGRELGRKCDLVELNPDYVEIQKRRLNAEQMHLLDALEVVSP